jgi:hypothetical protein
MPTLVATAGSETANSYALVADADTYFDERVQASNWTGESDEDVKERALIMATRRLDAFSYKGIKNASNQALKWPRDGVYDEDGEPYPTDEIPEFLKQATYELALDILNRNTDSEDPFADDGLDRFNRAKIGPMEVEVNHSASATPVPDYVLDLIRHVRSARSGMVAELERM